ncbi:sporulation peptidase YabG [Bacillus sp. AGMB 02131]|uniref:Sporulation peptidase YabG n=1 Tax=Peribacillus faecalis TaxID=2772559 RepID=A0A927D026_9BACI|nr:sporulation peptidase YabG [Peribacillus faecalis]MBD3108960.1 sporulation peptidase YabG [Peribacillus faecalis]
MTIKVGDIVGRIKYGCDLIFRVVSIRTVENEKIAVLYGEDIRLVADAPFEDLVFINDETRTEFRQRNEALIEHSFQLFSQDRKLLEKKLQFEATDGYRHQGEFFQMPGRVLHLDGDPSYLKKCMDVYEKIGIPVQGLYCNEKEMPVRVGSLLETYRPDILVITGHDSYSKAKGKLMDINAYRHSWHFAQTVKEARKKIPQLDQLVIFAGACQSHFESLISSGANFASSPSRVNIHALDPVYIVAKISFTPFMDRIHVWEALRNTLTGEKGIGGIETRGVLRTGMPYKILADEEV